MIPDDEIRTQLAIYLLTGTLLDFIAAQHALLVEASQTIQTNLERMNELRALLADVRRTLA